MIRVIEVTDEMLDDVREAEGLVNEPAVVDAGIVPVE